MASISHGLALIAFVLYLLASTQPARGLDLDRGNNQLAAANGSSSDSSDQGLLQMFPKRHECAPSQPRYTSRCYEELADQSLGCEAELSGAGSLDSVCKLTTSVRIGANSSIVGKGTLRLGPDVSLSCAQPGCEILILMSGDLVLEANSTIRGGTLTIQAANITVGANASINATALAGNPPAQTSGTPQDLEGAGGGHGGRGASCEQDESKDRAGTWGGDMYNWDKLDKPWVYGSRGGTTEEDATDLGGAGGGRIAVSVEDMLLLAGTIEANGGSVGHEGGGGSGGSVMVTAEQIEGNKGTISAIGGTGRGGGGGGRIAIDYQQMQDVDVYAHGGDSLGCQHNAGAAGTRFDAVSKSLFVSNNNKKSQTDTVLLTFPLRPLWGNLFVERSARIGVPLQWSRIQVLGTINMSSGSYLNFGIAEYPTSQSELVADDYVMENATVTVYGALWLTSKSFLMNHSKIDIVAGSDDWMVATSTVEASNIAYIGGGSEIRSNANLGVHGQGKLHLQGYGDSIKAQRLFLSLFYNVTIGHKAILQAPLKSYSSVKSEITTIFCEKNLCPVEVLTPSEDCNVNTSSPFTLQICRVEEINILGLVSGSVVHIQRTRTVTISPEGVISATALGCQGGLGKGKSTKGSGAGGGGGHGGRGGDGVLSSSNGGGQTYGNSELPCELGSGGGNPGLGSLTAGGGIIVLGSLEHPVTTLEVYGALAADGESSNGTGSKTRAEVGGSGGGSGGSLLLFLSSVSLGNESLLSTAGGHGGVIGGGGGGGGRVHFHWSKIPSGEEYMPIALGVGRIVTSGGKGSNLGHEGEQGTITGKKCPQGLYGIFCEECPVGTYKNDTGSSKDLCRECPSEKLPRRASYIYVRGGASQPTCPYNCTSEKFRMPHCYTMLEDLIHRLGGPYLFSLLVFSVMVTLACVLSVARMKLVGNDDFSMPASTRRGPQIDHSFPFLESLNEVLETNRVEDSESHIHRMYFMGSNSFGEPWHLPHSPPEQIADFVYEDAFNRFVEDVNSLAAYQWWEGSVHSILTVLAYPFSWSWQQWRRREKLHRLQEFVRSEYDHACLRSCRSRALYEGLKVAATPDLLLGYVDVFLGGDEKRPELPPKLRQRFPMSIIFGGDGSYLFSYSLESDNLLTSLLAQAVPSTMWYRLVAGMNAQLRTVRQGSLRSTLLPLITWLETHANPWLAEEDVRIDLAWCQATASGYYQLGVVLNDAEEVPQYFQPADMLTLPRSPGSSRFGSNKHIHEGAIRRRQSWHLSPSYSSLGIGRRRIGGATLDAVSIRSLEDRHYNIFPVSCLLRNIRPVGHQEAVGLIVSLFLLVDLTLTLLVLLQFYSVGIEAVLIIILVLPLASILPCAAGLNALFSSEARKSTGLARVYALWNVTSIVNTLVALVIGFVHYKLELGPDYNNAQPGHFNTEEDGWWLLPTLLLLTKFLQARMIDMYIANLEIHDHSIYSSDPTKFWEP
ncbi:hypothetical protein KC19_5G035100 [Ceratodon purpureus]|uniref:DUF8003 domain-containing protein n=1 Tax=Ceratodon purpureus TaxID=3225 RepID=A0A8T0HYU7_CERPU|nr:hypothetical protein KC19_5G035100 [Ceratodon purpureus]